MRFPFLSFPMALGVAALASQACGPTVINTSSDSTSAGTGATTGTGTTSGTGGAGGAPAGCPSDVPQDGAACGAVAGGCHYPVNCCSDTIATCSAGHWQVQPGPCVGKTPAPTCPTAEPEPGQACAGGCLSDVCSYGACPGAFGPAVSAQCEGGMWAITALCDAGGGGIPAGGLCGASADGGACETSLVCCYPCGTPGCMYKCTTPCDPGAPGCSGGCPELP